MAPWITALTARCKDFLHKLRICPKVEILIADKQNVEWYRRHRQNVTAANARLHLAVS